MSDAPSARVVPEALVVEHLAQHGWPFELHDGRADDARSAAKMALARFVDAGLPYRMSAGARCFDPVEVIQWMKREGVARRDPMLRDRCAPAARRMLAESAVAPELRVVMRRELHGAQVRRVRLPRPLSGASIVSIAPEGDAEIRLGDAFVDVRFAEAAAVRAVTLTFVVPRRSEADPAAPTDDDRALARAQWLAPDEGFARRTSTVTSLVSEIASTIASTRTHDRVVAALDALLARVAVGPVDHAAIDRADPLRAALDLGWVDCLLGASIGVALCRAQGIPARIVGGLLLYPCGAVDHYWLEAFDDAIGWRPYDLLGWDLAAGDRDDPSFHALFGDAWGRLITQRFPRAVTGPLGVVVPPRWRVLQRAVEGATESAVVALEDGDLRVLMRDRVAVTPQRSTA